MCTCFVNVVSSYVCLCCFIVTVYMCVIMHCLHQWILYVFCVMPVRVLDWKIKHILFYSIWQKVIIFFLYNSIIILNRIKCKVWIFTTFQDIHTLWVLKEPPYWNFFKRNPNIYVHTSNGHLGPLSTRPLTNHIWILLKKSREDWSLWASRVGHCSSSLNWNIILPSDMLRVCLVCVICNSSSFHSFFIHTHHHY